MTTERSLFKVAGMYCTNCKPIVEKQLKDEKAVKSINYSSNQLQIRI